MLMIRLARTGKTKQAYFRLIVSEKARDTHGDYLEALGSVNPHANPRAVSLKADRVKYWLEHGAKPSASVHNLLVDEGILQADKLRVWKPKQKAAPGGAAPEAPAAAKAAPARQAAEKPAEQAAEKPVEAAPAA